MYPEL